MLPFVAGLAQRVTEKMCHETHVWLSWLCDEAENSAAGIDISNIQGLCTSSPSLALSFSLSFALLQSQDKLYTYKALFPCFCTLFNNLKSYTFIPPQYFPPIAEHKIRETWRAKCGER
jgi:hypothetical protein